jgi:hypothetical protein
MLVVVVRAINAFFRVVAHQFIRLVGMSMTICASGALAGPPISGAINGATRGFKVVGYYAGIYMISRI